jgi:hypothetical protein
MVPVAVRRTLLVCTATLATAMLSLSIFAAPAVPARYAATAAAPGLSHVAPAPAPEAASVAILGLGMISLGVMRLRWAG